MSPTLCGLETQKKNYVKSKNLHVTQKRIQAARGLTHSLAQKNIKSIMTDDLV